MWIERNFPSPFIWLLLLAIALIAIVSADRAAGQDGLQPGEAFVTRFSGTTIEAGLTVIDTAGTVGSILDIRQPGTAPLGEHWSDAPQRGAVSAAEVGQVFGIAIDDGNPPNIYLTATSAFGLHRNKDNADWMAGMWGKDGGPGTVYKLNAEKDYAPELFAKIALDGRANSGPALGNIAFDPWNRQLYVSDLETGMIHRLALADGSDLGRYDHGIDGRAGFTDAASGETGSLPFVAFDPNERARIADCPAGEFATHPECWDYADFRRRVWALAVRRDLGSGEVRLYYSIWSSQGFSNPAFDTADGQEKRNSVWSVKIDEGGDFDVSHIRREFFLPDFFVQEADITRAGRSHPVADIAFPKTAEQTVMLLAERGGVGNLGLEARAPFAHPHEARVLRYELDAGGVWQPAGRYDVGFYDRERLGRPHLRANAAGGVDFGPGYGEDWQVDEDKPGEFVWTTGDALCSPEGPCLDPASGERSDRSEVDGLQGSAGDAMEAVAPAEALMAYPAVGVPYPPQGPGSSFMIDADSNAELDRSDATKIGDVEIHQPYPPEALVEAEPAGVGGADWGVPDYAAEEEWWPEPPPGAVAGEGIPGAGEGVQVTDLALQKAVPAPCQSGSLCNFAIVVTNTGTLPFTEPITIVDQLANDWTLAGWGPAGSQWDCQQTGTQLFCTHPAPDLKPGEAGAVIVDLQVPDGQVAGQWQNCAVLDFGPGGGDADPTNDKGCATIEFGPPAKTGEGPTEKLDLAIEKVAGSTECAPGKPCPFTVTIRNAGQVKFDGTFRFVDTKPAGWSFGNTSHGWWCVLTAGGDPLFSCWRELALDPGQSQSLNVTLTPPANAQAGQVENCAEIDWSQNEKDINAANDRACAKVETELPPPEGFGEWGMKEPEKEPPPPEGRGVWGGPGAKAVFNISKSGKSPCRYEAEECVFTVTISNTGNEDFDGGVFLTDEWLPGWTLTKAPADWKCSHPEPAKWRCANWVKFLVGGPPVTTSWSFKAPPDFNPGGGSVVKTNCAWALGKKACFQIKLEKGPKTEPDEKPTATFDLTIKKGPPHDAPGAGAGAGMFYVCEPLQPCPFTVTITNIGKDKYEGPFSFIDISTGGWSYGGVSPGWSCSPAGDAFTCTGKVSLAPGQSTTVNISLNPMPDVPVDPVQGENCVEIDWKGGPGDANKDNDGRDCMPVILSVGAPKAEAPEEPGKPPVTVAPDLTVEKRATRTICEPGEECEFIIIIRGTQNFPLKDKFKVSDTPPKGWTFAGGGKLGLWSCKTDKDKFTTCGYDVAKNPNLPPEGFTSSDVLATDIRFKVPSDAEHGVYINRVWVTFEPPPGGGVAKDYKYPFAEVQVGLRPNMEVSKTFDNAVCAPMEECSFTITVKNSGKGPYTGSLDITDTVEDRRLIVEYVESHPKWDCSITADPGTGQPGGVSCSRAGPFPHGTTEIAARVKAKIKDDAKTSELENCAVLKLRGKKASSLSKDEIVGCAKVQIGEETAITIEKSGPFLKTALTPEMTPGPGYQTGDPSKCNSNDICTFLIQIKPNWKGVYVAPLAVQDEMPADWELVGYEDKKDWSCAGMGTNIVTCLYDKGQAPVVMSQPIPLLIHAQVPDYSWHATVESDLENCSYIMVQHGAGYKESTKPKHEHCIGFAVRHKSYKYGSNAFAMQESGTESCAPPADCSYYEFTATRTNVPNAPYAGPLSIRVTLPPGSEFPIARITTSAKSCPASGWSCTKTGKEFGGVHTCRISECVMAPGEQVAVRLDGRVVPGMTVPPPTDLEKKACGVLEWQERPATVDIEQRGGKQTKEACATTTILGKPRQSDLQVSTTPQGRCAVGETCGAVISLGNVGQANFAEGIELQGQLSPPVSIRVITPLPTGWTCRTPGGGRYSCQAAPSEFAPGATARIGLALNIPSSVTQKQITHSVRIVWPPGKGDANPANDLALFTVPVAAVVQPRAYDLALAKTATGSCRPGQACRFRLRVLNQGVEAFEGAISIVDRFSRRGVTLRGTAGGLSCQGSGATLSCMAANQVLKPGAQAIFLIDTTLPRVTRSTTLRNCAEIAAPGGINVDRPSRDDIRALQLALNQAGYDAGTVDGVIGSRTRGAIAAARADLGLSRGAQIDEALVGALFGDTGQRDINPRNDSDCVTIELPAPKVAPAPPKQPPPSKPARPKKEPSKPVLCRGGKVQVGNRCVCPRGTTEVRGRCVRPPTIQVIPPAPPKTVGCTGGKVPVGNRCVCPSGTTEVRGKCLRLQVIPPTIQKAVPPKRCTGGQVLRNGRCVCPPDKPNFINGKCQPLLKVIPLQPPKFQMIPLCPRGQKWVPELNSCVTIVQ